MIEEKEERDGEIISINDFANDCGVVLIKSQ